jgi:hypothetical protein
MKLRPCALVVDPVPRLATIPRLAIDAVCDSVPHCLAATSSIIVDGQPLVHLIPFGFLLDGSCSPSSQSARRHLRRHPAPSAATVDLCLQEVGNLVPYRFGRHTAAFEVPHESLPSHSSDFSLLLMTLPQASQSMSRVAIGLGCCFVQSLMACSWDELAPPPPLNFVDLDF